MSTYIKSQYPDNIRELIIDNKKKLLEELQKQGKLNDRKLTKPFTKFKISNTDTGIYANNLHFLINLEIKLNYLKHISNILKNIPE